MLYHTVSKLKAKLICLVLNTQNRDKSPN